jgi:hypothetical protein
MTPAMRAALLQKRRSIRQTFAALTAQRTGAQVMLEKKRSSGAVYEHHVYTQLGPNSPEWARWVFSNSANSPSAEGALRMCLCTRALLVSTSTEVRPDANDLPVTSQTVGVSTVKTTANGTETGTFATSTFDTLATRWSATAGEKVVYTITGVERIAVRGYATSNGGIAKVTVKTGGVEIAAGKYVIPLSGSDRLISFIGSGYHLTHQAATDLDSALTYEVTIEVDATNPGGGRMYQAGLFGYAAGWDTTDGFVGTFRTASVGGLSVAYAKTGNTVITECADCTKLVWRGCSVSDAAIIQFDVRNSDGTVVFSDTFDTYAASAGNATTHTITSGLPRGTYYLHTYATGTKNASSTGYTLYHRSVDVINELASGDPATGTFDLLDAPALATSTATGTSDYIGYDVTLERVVAVSKTSELEAASDFVGGIHGHETLGTPVFKVDGVVVDFAAGAVGARWVGSEVTCEYETTLLFPSDSSPFGTASYLQRTNADGYEIDLTDTLSADAKLYTFYSFMHSYPSTLAGTTGLGGGYDKVNLERRIVYRSPGEGEDRLAAVPAAIATWNNAYTAVGWPLNYSDVAAVFAGISGANTGSRHAFVATNAFPRDKLYLLPFSTVSGITVPSSTSWRINSFWGVAKTNDFGIRL